MIKQQLWKILFWLLFWLGVALVIAGFTSELVLQKWGTISLALIICGFAICAVLIGIQIQRSGWSQQRSTQAGTNALITTLTVLVILGLINFLGLRYHLRTDLTETQLFTLAPQSRELVRNLPKTAKVWVFSTDENIQDRELLANYQRQSPKFQFEYVDPQVRPGLAEKFGVKDFGEVYLEFGNKRQLVQTINENEHLSEIKLTNHLQQILSSTTGKVYFLQGHGEHQLLPGKGGFSQAIQGLGSRNLPTSSLNLTETQRVPEDAAVVVVAGPQRALFAEEVQALKAYQELGGNLLLMIDPNTDPKIDSLLQDWGVILDNRLAVDISGASLGLGPAAPLVTEYGNHPITKDFNHGISFYRLARPLTINPVANIESTPLLLTKPYPRSWAESDQKSEKLAFHQGDLKGPLVLGVALRKKIFIQPISNFPVSPIPTSKIQISPVPSVSPIPIPTSKIQISPVPSVSPIPITIPTSKIQISPVPSPKNNPPSTPKESRLVVLGNSDFATNGLFDQQLNGDVFLNSVTWLSQQDQETLSIRPKEPKNRRITLSSIQTNLLILSSLLLLPFIGLATSAVIWWKRR